jgi:hypothetical protein
MRGLPILLLLLLSPFPAAKEQGDIHRCMGADGTPVFTARVCAAVNATPVAPAPAASSGVHVSVAPASAPAVTCATDLKQLRQAVIDAFAERKPNRLAGLMLWNGDGKDAVVADIRDFTRLMSHPLIQVKSLGAASDADDDDAADASAPAFSSTSRPAPAHEALIVQTESDDGGDAGMQTRFDVVHQSGCVWLRPQGG